MIHNCLQGPVCDYWETRELAEAHWAAAILMTDPHSDVLTERPVAAAILADADLWETALELSEELEARGEEECAECMCFAGQHLADECTQAAVALTAGKFEPSCVWCGEQSNADQGEVSLSDGEHYHDDCVTAAKDGAVAQQVAATPRAVADYDTATLAVTYWTAMVLLFDPHSDVLAHYPRAASLLTGQGPWEAARDDQDFNHIAVEVSETLSARGQVECLECTCFAGHHLAGQCTQAA